MPRAAVKLGVHSRKPSRHASVTERRAAMRAELLASLTASAIVPTYDLTRGNPVELCFFQALTDAGYSEFFSDQWPCELAHIDGDPESVEVLFRQGAHARVYRFPDGTLSLVEVGSGWISVRTAAPAQAFGAAVCAAFRASYPASYMTQTDDPCVPITFWTNGPFGPSPRLRRIEAATWDEIEGNYTAVVHDELASIMGWSSKPESDGQLLLWQGPPGTGKTWALRALASEWSRWAEFHYITDPDSFFVKDPSYMINVLLSDSYDVIEADTDEIYSQTDAEGKWRVLILEDTGELLAANAKDSYGQGLSRLLNVVDGMIGQGLRVLALVTTNDELGDLHPAAARPGRCASQIEFGPLTDEEARAWTGDPDATSGTLAELYALKAAGQDAFSADDPEADWATGVPESIDPDALAAIEGFWEENPDILEEEQEDSDADPLDDPVGYFREELLEPAHVDIRDAVEATGFLTLDLAERWMKEEVAESEEYDLDDLLIFASEPLLIEDEPEILAPEATDLLASIKRLVEEGNGSFMAAAGLPPELGPVREALQAIAASHDRSVEGIVAVLTAAASPRDRERSDELTLATLDVLSKFAARPAAPPARTPDIHVHVPQQDVAVTVEGSTFTPQIDVHVPEHAPQPAPTFEITVPEPRVEVHVVPSEAPIVQVAAAAAPEIHVHVPDQKSRTRSVRREYDDAGIMRYVIEDDAE